MIKCFYNNTDRPDCICTEEGYGIISQIEPDPFIPQRDHIHPSAGDDVFGNSVKVPEGQELIYNGKTGRVTMTCRKGAVITMPKPEKEGYTFRYWKGSAYKAGDRYTVKGDHTFTAQWKREGAGPDTGDDSQLLLWIILMGASLLVLVNTIALHRRSER